jgi:hypothetical protein
MKVFKMTFVTILVVVGAGIGYSQTVWPVAADAAPPADLTGALKLANESGTPDVIIELTTDGGIYELSRWDSVSVSFGIRAAAGLTNKPIIRASAGDTLTSVFRVWADFTVEGIIFDGKRTDGTLNPFTSKDVIGVIPNPADNSTPRNNIVIRDCEFWNVYQNADPDNDIIGNAFRVRKVGDYKALLGNLLIENTHFENMPDETILMQKVSGTEDPYERVADTVIVRNCTFINCGGGQDNQGCFTIKGSVDTTVVTAKIYLENLTFYNSGPRCIYSRESEGMEVKNIIIANTNPDGKSGSLIKVDRNGSVISHVDTFAIVNLGGADAFRAEAGEKTGHGMATLDTETIYNYDPEFADPGNGDLMVKNAELYTLASDGGLLGDLRWKDPTISAIIDHSAVSTVPEDFSLSQNYPNPFNPVTTIRYSLDKSSDISINVYNLAGQLVETLYAGKKAAGEYSITWDASHLSSGVYFYKLVSGSNVVTKKMMLIK